MKSFFLLCLALLLMRPVEAQPADTTAVWLVEAGLQEEQSDRGAWKATFHTAGASAFLHLQDPEDQEMLDQVRRALDDLPSRYAKLFRVVERAELDTIGADPNVACRLVRFRTA